MSARILGHGVYTFGEAARLTRLNTRRIRSWFNERTPVSQIGVVFHGDYPSRNSLSFLDLIEVLVAGNLREQGVSLISIRKVHCILSEQLQTPHPFCHHELLTDGQSVFVTTAADADEPEMVEILKQQRVFPKVLLPYLKRVDYDKVSQLAKEWNIADGIVIDPSRRFGKPLVATCGIPSSILASAYHANQNNAELVAAWYGIPPQDVRIAVDFQSRYFGNAA